MKTIILASTLLFSVAGSALAADAVVYGQAPEPAPAGFVWTGGYVGLQAGYAWGTSPFESRWDDDEGLYFERTDFDPDGAFGGIYLGYNRQLENMMVLGIEGDINAGDLTGDAGTFSWSDSGGGNGVSDSRHNSSRMNWNGAVRGRVGYALDRFLPYFAGGVSFGGYEFGAIDRDFGYVHYSEEETMIGWNIGGGLEYAATDNLILRGEYRYTDFGSETYHGLGGADSSTIELRFHDIRFGVAYKF